MKIRETAEIQSDIRRMSRESGVLLLAHHYCDPDVTGACDFAGDEIELLRRAESCEERHIVVCGCAFTAEKIKLIRPELKVTLAHPQSRCPVSGQVSALRVERYLEEHPEGCACCGLVFPVKIMALCRRCFTQSNAAEVIASLEEREVLMVTDSALAQSAARRCPDKQITSWSCRCPAFSNVQTADIELARQRYRGLEVLANSMCGEAVTELAELAGSSTEILRRGRQLDGALIADEVSICALLQKENPGREYHQIAPAKLMCSAMKRCGLAVLERVFTSGFGMEMTLPYMSAAESDHAARLVRESIHFGKA